MRIIKATVEDVPRIMECAREFTSLIPDCPLNAAHYGDAWRTFISSGVGAIFMLETVPDRGSLENRVLGGIGGIAHPDLLTGKLSAVELFWYVKPDYRKGTWPVRLLKCFEDWAKEVGCSHVAMIYMECSMADRMQSFYERRGYTLFETMYRKRI